MNEKEIKHIVENILSSGISKGERGMTLAAAEKLCGAVKGFAEKAGVNAVICVSDEAGYPKLVLSMDGAYIASYDVAVNKAFTVVALKMPTSELKSLAQPGASLYGIQFTNSGKIVIFGGGEPLCADGGRIIGGLGVSGGTEEQDTLLAKLGKEYFENNFGRL